MTRSDRNWRKVMGWPVRDNPIDPLMELTEDGPSTLETQYENGVPVPPRAFFDLMNKMRTRKPSKCLNCPYRNR